MSSRSQLKAITTVTALAAVVALTGCAQAADGGTTKNDPMVFQSLAFQPGVVAALDDIVAEWNDDNPNDPVELVQGDWGSALDQLTTSFQAGTAPDIFHFDDVSIRGFASDGDLLDLKPLLSDEFVSDIQPSAWATVTQEDGSISGVPYLAETWLVFANKQILEESGVRIPTFDDPWTWDEYRKVAKTMTNADHFGAGLSLKAPGNRMLSFGQGFGADFFEEVDGKVHTLAGDAETAALEHLHDMLYVDKSIPTAALGLSSSEFAPMFLNGEVATIIANVWQREAFINDAPEGFEWVALPPLKGTSMNQTVSSQTYSVSADTENPEAAVRFVEFALNAENQVKIAKGDWLIPTSITAQASPELNDPAVGGDAVMASSKFLVEASHQRVTGLSEWVSKVAQPLFQKYLANNISLEDLRSQLVSEGDAVLSRYDR